MGFLQDLGLDELVPAVGELINELSGLKDDLIGGIQEGIVNPISEDIADIKGTVQDSADSISGTIKPE